MVVDFSKQAPRNVVPYRERRKEKRNVVAVKLAELEAGKCQTKNLRCQWLHQRRRVCLWHGDKLAMVNQEFIRCDDCINEGAPERGEEEG